MDYDDAFANAPYIPGGAGYAARWEAEAAAFRASRNGRDKLGLRYGPGARNFHDLFLPEGSPAGLVVFLHGGFWRMFGPRDWSHLAAGALARGWAVSIPGYTLCPEARIGAITGEIAAAVSAAAAEVAGPVVVTGHSAGGHLAARMACTNVRLPVADRLVRSVPISPLADLRPLMRTAMNSDLQLEQAEAERESPMFRTLRGGVQVHVWVGADERPAFVDQARWLADAWNCALTIEPGRHHFDVIEGLATPGSALIAALLGPS